MRVNAAPSSLVCCSPLVKGTPRAYPWLTYADSHMHVVREHVPGESHHSGVDSAKLKSTVGQVAEFTINPQASP